MSDTAISERTEWAVPVCKVCGKVPLPGEFEDGEFSKCGHRARDYMEHVLVIRKPSDAPEGADRKAIIAALRILQDRSIGSPEANERAADALIAALGR